MILLFEKRDAGLTIFEALISLAILSFVAVVALSASRGASPKLEFNRNVAELRSEAQHMRHRAVASSRSLSWTPPHPSCNGVVIELMYHADGTASGGSFCLLIHGARVTMQVDPLSGQLIYEDPFE